jgi:hypothetical protein
MFLNLPNDKMQNSYLMLLVLKIVLDIDIANS